MTATQAQEFRLTVEEVAELVGGRLIGDPSVRIHTVAPLGEAGDGALGFLAARTYVKRLHDSRASALLVAEELASAVPDCVPTRVVVPDAHAALATLLDHVFPERRPEPGVHGTAVLGRGVRLGERVSIGAYAVLDEGVELGDDVVVSAHCCVGAGARIGPRSWLHPHVVLYPGVELGARVIVHSGARLGVDGFGYVPADSGLVKVPQVGRCVIEDDVEIGANTTVDRGSIGRTVVARGAKLDNLVHLGHNVSVGTMSMLAAMTGVAGSSRIGARVLAGGQAGISGHLEVGDGARLAAQAGVIGDVPPGETVSGYPARPHRQYLRAMGQVFRLPELAARVGKLEDALMEYLDGTEQDFE